MNYQIGTCRGCFTRQYIVNRNHWLCRSCNQERLRSQSGSRPTTSQKHIQRYPDFGFNSQIDLFQSLWKALKPYSYISGLPIREFDISNFAHVLSKKQYPAFRLYPKNIVLLTRYEHNLWDQGTRTLRAGYPADWKALELLAEELRVEYEMYKKSPADWPGLGYKP